MTVHGLLEVHRHSHDDVYHDRARIAEGHRGGVKESTICAISANGRSVLLEVRGLESDTNEIIRLDDRTRVALGVELGVRYWFAIRPVSWLGQFRWAWNASDPTARIAARLGLLSLFLGIVALLVAAAPLMPFLSGRKE